MKLPEFKPTQYQTRWIASERRTARFISAFWLAASTRQRKDPEFIWFLTASAWTNTRSDGSGRESTREWRNGHLADYLGVKYATIAALAVVVSQAFPRLKRAKARELLETYTGITHHYTAIRPRTRRYILRHAAELYDLFTAVSSQTQATVTKIRKVATRLAAMPRISTPRGGSTSALNPLSPVLACLHPSHRFPIMNQQTRQLLRAIGKENDGDGAIALYNLIGSRGIHDSFELDVYSSVAQERRFPAVRTHSSTGRSPRAVPLKSELDSLARLAAHRVKIRKEHNKLTNRFRKAVFANFPPQEANFDLLIDGWKKGRKLLIEAKTDWKGSAGRMQVRQAIGQLFDYRLQHFAKKSSSVDLAILLPTEPSEDIKALLASLRIIVLWFSGPRLCGTVKLPW